jgi:hypothetical protein
MKSMKLEWRLRSLLSTPCPSRYFGDEIGPKKNGSVWRAPLGPVKAVLA